MDDSQHEPNSRGIAADEGETNTGDFESALPSSPEFAPTAADSPAGASLAASPEQPADRVAELAARLDLLCRQLEGGTLRGRRRKRRTSDRAQPKNSATSAAENSLGVADRDAEWEAQRRQTEDDLAHRQADIQSLRHDLEQARLALDGEWHSLHESRREWEVNRQADIEARNQAQRDLDARANDLQCKVDHLAARQAAWNEQCESYERERANGSTLAADQWQQQQREWLADRQRQEAIEHDRRNELDALSNRLREERQEFDRVRVEFNEERERQELAWNTRRRELERQSEQIQNERDGIEQTRSEWLAERERDEAQANERRRELDAQADRVRVEREDCEQRRREWEAECQSWTERRAELDAQAERTGIERAELDRARHEWNEVRRQWDRDLAEYQQRRAQEEREFSERVSAERRACDELRAACEQHIAARNAALSSEIEAVERREAALAAGRAWVESRRAELDDTRVALAREQCELERRNVEFEATLAAFHRQQAEWRTEIQAHSPSVVSHESPDGERAGLEARLEQAERALAESVRRESDLRESLDRAHADRSATLEQLASWQARRETPAPDAPAEACEPAPAVAAQPDHGAGLSSEQFSRDSWPAEERETVESPSDAGEPLAEHDRSAAKAGGLGEEGDFQWSQSYSVIKRQVSLPDASSSPSQNSVEDEGVNAYMSRLFERLREQSGRMEPIRSEEAAAFSAPTGFAAESSVATQGQLNSTLDAGAGMSPDLLSELPARSRGANPLYDMTAMRQIANEAARSNVGQHGRRVLEKRALKRGALSVLGLAAGGAMLAAALNGIWALLSPGIVLMALGGMNAVICFILAYKARIVGKLSAVLPSETSQTAAASADTPSPI